MTMLRAQSVQAVLCYDKLIKQVASNFERKHNFNLSWEKIKKYFGVSWSEFYHDVIIEINSRVFKVVEKVLYIVIFRYEKQKFGIRLLIPMYQELPL